MTRGTRIHYSDAELIWLEANRDMVISDYHAAFCAKFRRTDVAAIHLHGLRKRRGWKVGRSPGRLAGRSWKFSAAETAWLKTNCTMILAEYHHSFCGTFGRSDVTAQQLHALRKRRGWKTGRTGRFEKGAVPANKGRKMPFNANCARTQFKKGSLPGNYRGPGYERIDGTTGYVILIVAETNPWTGAKTRPVHKQRWLWERANGPLPNGMVLKCLDGNKLNTDPSNWEAVPRALMTRLNGGPRKTRVTYDAAPLELKPTILAVAKLEHGLRERRRRTDSAGVPPANHGDVIT
jgi:hypothetical protein